MVMPYYMESQNLNSKNFNKLRMPPLACLLEQENLITFHLFYSVSTGCQFVIEFILKSFFSPGKHFHDMAPAYISELINLHNPSRQLRSSHKNLLSVSRTFSSHGDRTFYSCAPKLWNSLPADLRFCSSLDIFKKTLKSHLFKIAYDST